MSGCTVFVFLSLMEYALVNIVMGDIADIGNTISIPESFNTSFLQQNNLCQFSRYRHKCQGLFCTKKQVLVLVFEWSIPLICIRLKIASTQHKFLTIKKYQLNYQTKLYPTSDTM